MMIVMVIMMNVLQVQCRRAVAAGLHTTLQTRLPGCLVGHHADNDYHGDDSDEVPAILL